MPVFIFVLFMATSLAPHMGQWEDCVQSLVKTEDEAKVLAQQIAGLTCTIEESPCNPASYFDGIALALSGRGDGELIQG